MLDSLRALRLGLPRFTKQTEKNRIRQAPHFPQSLHRTPTGVEVAEYLGVSLEEWHRLARDTAQMEVAASSRSSEDLPAREVPAGKESQPDNLCARQQMKSVLGMALQTLPERYRKIVAMYYTKEMTMKDIGTAFGINESRVSQIHHAALLKLNAVLQSNGIQSSQAF